MNSFISWVGGKKLLRKEIIKKFPKEEIEKYVEPFGGAAWVLFGKTPHSKEVYNDINGELVNLFRMVKYHPEALQQQRRIFPTTGNATGNNDRTAESGTNVLFD